VEGPQPIAPDYGGACIDSVVPALLGRFDRPAPDWLPEPARRAPQVVLLVLDGLGWEQLQERRHLAPTLAAMTGSSITSVAPTTTATALTSIVTGVPPAVHGVVGYRVHVGDGQVMNVLRWSTPAGDASALVPPAQFQRLPAFLGQPVPAVIRSEFLRTGFTAAFMSGARLRGWRVPSTLVVEVAQLLASGEPLVYAYYDGIDRVAHEFGLGDFYDAELHAADALVAELIDQLPAGAVVLVTADHGQVDVGDRVLPIDGSLMADVELLSGEGRFRWLHVRPGRAEAVRDRARTHYGDVAWVADRSELEDAGWFGGRLSDAAAARLGDVALVPYAPVAFVDPSDTGETKLVSRHGSLTAAEMLVPLVASG
jgi:predicted AlkP superfamily pyrophosphatase or phosphodiesterase